MHRFVDNLVVHNDIGSHGIHLLMCMLIHNKTINKSNSAGVGFFHSAMAQFDGCEESHHFAGSLKKIAPNTEVSR
jgi:hypothetical protein